MIGQRTILLFGMFLFPFYALAHGEEVLLPLLIQLGSIFIFVILVTSIKFKIADKLILAAAYFLTLIIVLYLSWDVPYRQNKTLLDLVWTIGPAAVVLITFFVLKIKRGTRTETLD